MKRLYTLIFKSVIPLVLIFFGGLEIIPAQSKGKGINSSKPQNQIPNRSNYCQPPLFCPDIEDVQVALFENKNKFQKGKFEKTVDWERRKSSVLSEVKLKDGRTLGDRMVFLYEQGTLSQFLNTPEYDADKEWWSFYLEFLQTSTQTCLPIISQRTSSIVCLMIPKLIGTTLKAYVPMPTSVAAINDNNLQIAFVGKVIEPYTWLSEYTPIKDVSSGIHFELEEIICINPKNSQSWKVNAQTMKIISSNQESFTNDNSNSINVEDERKIDDLKRRLLINQMDADLHAQLGIIYWRRKEIELAISSLKTALLWNNSSIVAQITLGEIYLEKGNCEIAQEYLKSSLRIDSKNPSAILLKSEVEKCSSN